MSSYYNGQPLFNYITCLDQTDGGLDAELCNEVCTRTRADRYLDNVGLIGGASGLCLALQFKRLTASRMPRQDQCRDRSSMGKERWPQFDSARPSCDKGENSVNSVLMLEHRVLIGLWIFLAQKFVPTK